jgi:hypothetical protein
MHVFEIKRLNGWWYYRCETRGIGAHDPFKGWTQEKAIQHATNRAVEQPPAEILIFEHTGKGVTAVHRVG